VRLLLIKILASHGAIGPSCQQLHHRFPFARSLAIGPPCSGDRNQSLERGPKKYKTSGVDSSALRVKLIDKLGDYAEVTPSATNGPEDIGVCFVIYDEDRPFSGYERNLKINIGMTEMRQRGGLFTCRRLSTTSPWAPLRNPNPPPKVNLYGTG
jgi:hypothetical protein